MIKKIFFNKKNKLAEEENEEIKDKLEDENDEEELEKDNKKEEFDEEDDESENIDISENKTQNPSPSKEKSWIKKDGELAVDIYETENDIVIMAPVGGISRDEIEIITEKDMVIIKGNRERKECDEIKNFYSKECFFGPFSREIILPEETDPSRIKANLESGILIIKAPKIEREKRRKINI